MSAGSPLAIARPSRMSNTVSAKRAARFRSCNATMQATPRSRATSRTVVMTSSWWRRSSALVGSSSRNRRGAHQCLGDGHHLLLSAGQVTHERVGQWLHVEPLQQGGHAAHVIVIDAAPVQVFPGQQDHVEPRQRGLASEALRQVAHPPAPVTMLEPMLHFTFERDRAARWHQQARDAPEQRRLAGRVRTDQHGQRTRLDRRHVDVVQHRMPPVAERHAIHRQCHDQLRRRTDSTRLMKKGMPIRDVIMPIG